MIWRHLQFTDRQRICPIQFDFERHKATASGRVRSCTQRIALLSACALGPTALQVLYIGFQHLEWIFGPSTVMYRLCSNLTM